jgi:hypothetical protein
MKHIDDHQIECCVVQRHQAGGATVGSRNAKALCLEPNADGLPDMQIIIHDRNAAHSGLLPLVPALP